MKLKDLLFETESHPVYDDTVKDPETGREIKVRSALQHDTNDAIYKLAKKKVDAAKGDSKGGEEKKKSASQNMFKKNAHSGQSDASKSDDYPDSFEYDQAETDEERDVWWDRRRQFGGFDADYPFGEYPHGQMGRAYADRLREIPGLEKAYFDGFHNDSDRDFRLKFRIPDNDAIITVTPALTPLGRDKIWVTNSHSGEGHLDTKRYGGESYQKKIRRKDSQAVGDFIKSALSKFK